MPAAQLDRSQHMGGPPDSALERSANRSTYCPIFRLQTPPIWLYYFLFGFPGDVGVKITSSWKNHRKPGWPAVRRRRTHPPSFGVCGYAHTRGRLYPPVIYRRPMTLQLSPARRSRNGSSKPSCRADLHLGVSRPTPHNIRLRQSCDGLSAGGPGAYHGAFYRVVPGRRMTARRRCACSRSAATASMGSRQ
jgi:hypothetical protein